MDRCAEVREKILNEVKEEIERLNIKPKLAIISCSDDKPSKLYIKNKIKACESVGIEVKVFDLNPSETTLEVLSEIIYHANHEFNGIILQLPLADKFKPYEHELLNLIDPIRDIDGLTDVNKVKLLNKEDCLIPATAEAIHRIMEHELGMNDFSGKKVCIINRSALVGLPLSILLLNHNASPMICHSKTAKDINDFLMTNNFDVIVSAIGKHIIDEFYIENTLIIDAGISYDENNKLLRDIMRYDYNNNNYQGKIGICTTAIVAANTLKAYKFQNNIK